MTVTWERSGLTIDELVDADVISIGDQHYIRKDGTSTTTASIPFAVGLSSAGLVHINNAAPNLRFSVSSVVLGNITGSSTDFTIEAGSDTGQEAGADLNLLGGDALALDFSGGYVRLHGGVFIPGSDTQQNGFVTTDTAVTSFSTSNLVNNSTTAGNEIEDFYVGGQFYGASNSSFENGIGLHGRLAPTTYTLLTTGESAQIIGMDRRASGAGNTLTIQAGWAQNGGTNLAGGQLILAPGKGTGNAAGNVAIQAFGGGGSGTTDRTPSAVATFKHDRVTTSNNVSGTYVIEPDTGGTTSLGGKTSDKISFYGVTGITQPGATTDLGTVLSNLGLRASGTAYPISTSGLVSFNNTTDATNGNTPSVLTLGGIRSAKRIYANTGFFAEANPSTSDAIAVQPTQLVITNGLSGNTATLTNNGTDLLLTMAGTGVQGLRAAQLRSTALTSGRVTIATTGGTLSDSANLVYTSGTGLLVSDNVKLQTAGNGLYVKEGSNATMGTATLSAGAVTVNTTKVTANSRIFLTTQSLGTVAVPMPIAVTTRSAGTSFTITSSDGTDTSVIAWLIMEPA